MDDLRTETAFGTIYSRIAVHAAPADAPQVVLVHGLGVSSRYMVPTLERFAPHWRTYAPDLPGFGRSARPKRALDVPTLADALAAWMEAVGVADAVLVGNSMGCQVVVHTAARYPHLASRAVLIGPTIDRHARRAWRQGLRVLRAGVLHEPFSGGAIVVADYLRAGIPRVLATLRHALRDRIEEQLPRVRIPALVVLGSRDAVVSRRWAAEVAERLPRGALVVIPGAPHMLNYASPLELYRVVRPLIDEGRLPAESRDAEAS